MAQRQSDELIKVHVTPHQRETLEFLVNRRLSDVRNHLYRASSATISQIQTWQAESESLETLKHELQQAGT